MSDGSAVLDDAVLEELAELGRELSQDVLGEVVTAYRKLAPELVHEIEAAAVARAFESLARAAHTLKGSSAQIGAVAVREAARELEADGRAARSDRLEALVARCRAAFEAADQALARRIGSAP